MFNPKRLDVLMAGLLLLSASLFAQSTPALPPANSKVEAPSAEKLDPNSVAQAVDPRSYEIGAEDILRIVVWQSAEFSSVQSVRPDGKISLPLIGDVQAEGLTPNRLKATLTQALKDYVESPDVTIYIQQVNSKSYRVSGWVNRPAKYPLVTPIKVYEAIADAGGFREYANLKEVTIMRGTQRIKFNAKDYRDGKNLDKNIFVENGDIIEVKD
ncbi:MAG: polysaccharide biosynthesis/export family protein [Bryobacteraceae bacterium]